jgi:hypothetical protein
LKCRMLLDFGWDCCGCEELDRGAASRIGARSTSLPALRLPAGIFASVQEVGGLLG